MESFVVNQVAEGAYVGSHRFGQQLPALVMHTAATAAAACLQGLFWVSVPVLGSVCLCGDVVALVWAARECDSTPNALLKSSGCGENVGVEKMDLHPFTTPNALHAPVPAGMSSRRRCAGGGSSRSEKSARPASRQKQRPR
jgi:hypothetical protein